MVKARPFRLRIPITRDSAVRTERNETRFVLPEVKCQSRRTSGGAGGTQQKLCRRTTLNLFASL